MATAQLLIKDDVELSKFPEEKEFQFNNDKYLVRFSSPREIRMSYYIRDVQVFKNERLYASGETEDPDNLELTSPDKRYLFVPFKSSYTIYDLQTGLSLTDGLLFQNNNQFDQTSRFLLTTGETEYKLTNLETGEVIRVSKYRRVPLHPPQSLAVRCNS